MNTDGKNGIVVTAAPHPFRVEQYHAVVEHGLTVSEILARVQPDPVLRRHAYVEVDGVAVPPEWWPYLRPRRPVLIRTVPAGGGGDDKNVMRTVALIAVSIVSSGVATAGWAKIGSGASAWFAGGSASAVALGAATALAGRALINQIAPPARPDEPGQGANASARLYGLRGTRNRLTRGEPVPRIMGLHRFTPPYAAEPFTEVVGDEQYLRALFCWGYGPVVVSEIRIGDTSIEDFDDVEVETVSDNTVEGHPDLFSRSVDERTLNVGLTNSAGYVQRTTDDVADEITFDVLFPRGLFELDDNGNRLERTVTIKAEYAEAGTGVWKTGGTQTGAQTLTVSVPTSRTGPRGDTLHYAQKHLIVVDAFDGTARVLSSSKIGGYATPADPSLLSKPSEPAWGHQIAVVEVSSNGGIQNITELSNADVTGFGVTQQSTSDTLDIASGTVEERKLVVTESKAEAFRRTMRIRTPDGTKTYDVRLKRETADHDTADQIYDKTTWNKLRAVQFDKPVTMEHVALTAIRIRSSDQLNGTLDEVNGLCQAIMDDYDTTNDVWITDAAAVTPAAAFRNVLEGRANGRAVSQSRIDLPSLEAWAEFTVPLAVEFNHVFTGGNVTDALDTIASAGRASKTLVDGKWGVVVDDEKTTVVQHFTPRNSFDFQAERVFGEKVHALRVAFVNKDKDYQQDELVVYNDGFTADGTAPDETPPFPNDSGGYEVATRFEGIQATGAVTEAEAFKAGRYHLAVDALRPEVYTLRTDVEHLVATRGDLVRVTHDVPQWGTGYGRVKSVSTDSSGDVDEVVLDTDVVLDALEDYVIRFRLADGTTKLVDVGDPASDTSTDTFTPVTPISSGKPAAGDLAMVGLSGKESVEAVIKSIEPGTDLSAKLTLVDHAPAVQDAHDENIPTFDPRITEVAFVQSRPPAPEVDSVESDESALKLESDGTLTPRIAVGLSVPSNNEDVDVSRFQVRYRLSDANVPFRTNDGSSDDGVVFADDVEQGKAYEIEARSVSRQSVVSSWVSVASSHVVVGKSSVPQDVAGFTVNPARDRINFSWTENPEPDVARYVIREGGTDWASATEIARVDADELTLRDVANGPWWIKALDTSGNLSTNAAKGTITVSLPSASGLRAQVIDNTVLLRWNKSAGTFDLQTFEIREGSSLDTAEVIGTSDKTFDVLTELEAGDYTYWVVPIDEADNEGTAASIKVAVDAPPDFELRNTFQTDFQGFDTTTKLVPVQRTELPDKRSTYELTGLQFDGVDDYVAVDKNYASAGAISTLTVEAWVRVPIADGGGTAILSFDRSEYYRFTVGSGTTGNSAGGDLYFCTTDDTSQSTSTGTHDLSTSLAQPINDGRWHHVAAVYDGTDKILYLDGDEVARATNPHNGNNLGTGTTRYGFIGDGSEASSFNGTRSDTFFKGFVSELREWSVARTQTELQNQKDHTLDGNETGLDLYYRMQEEGTATDVETLSDKTSGRQDGTIFGAARHVPATRAVAPSDDLSRDELDGLGYNTRDDMIAAGLDYRAQPTAGTGKFVEVYDAGAVIPSTRVTVTLDQTDLAGSVSTEITISTKENTGDAWNDFPAGLAQVFATQFRWVKVTVDYTASNDEDLARLNEIRTKLSTKLRSDSGTATVNSNPTTISFNVDYINVNSINVTPQGTSSRIAVVDFNDVQNPTGFDVYLFDSGGNAVTGDVRWEARGT